MGHLDIAPMPMRSASGVAIAVEHGRQMDIYAVTKTTWAALKGRDTPHTAETVPQK